MDNKYKGVVGLINNGNYCFMNSSIQCLSSILPLTEYFINDYYKKDINSSTPSKSNGRIVQEYAKLLKQIWDRNPNNEKRILNPIQIKEVFGKINKFYSDNSQKDAIEFLIFFLDSLHEDLNKVKYQNNQPNEPKNPTKIWNTFLSKNNSIIIQLFYGMYQSSVECLNCGHISNNFEPFLNVNLPIYDESGISSNKRIIFKSICFVIFFDISSTPIQFSIPIYKEWTTIGYLKQKICKILKMKLSSFISLKIFKKGDIDQILDNNFRVSAETFRDGNLFFFQKNPEINNEHTIINEKVFDELKNFEIENIQKIYQEEEENEIKNDECEYEWLQVILLLFNYSLLDNTPMVNKISFPRPFYINKSWTTEDLYHNLMLYFLRVYFISSEKLTKIDFILKNFFKNLSKSQLNQINYPFSYESQSELGYPFFLQFLPIINTTTNTCIFCGSINCKGCPIPYRKDITIEMIMTIIERNCGECSNKYFYIPKRERDKILPQKDFVIKVVWLPNYVKELKKLSNKVDLDVPDYFALTIYDCFNLFVQTEKLKEDNQWKCDKCQKPQNANKHLDIYKSPDILIIGLNRFKNSKKNNIFINYPINNFDISKYVIEKDDQRSSLYDLIGVIHHSGSLDFGHYISYCKHQNNKWFLHNDNVVQEVNCQKIISNTAYILFYQRKTLNEKKFVY